MISIRIRNPQDAHMLSLHVWRMECMPRISWVNAFNDVVAVVVRRPGPQSCSILYVGLANMPFYVLTTCCDLQTLTCLARMAGEPWWLELVLMELLPLLILLGTLLSPPSSVRPAVEMNLERNDCWATPGTDFDLFVGGNSDVVWSGVELCILQTSSQFPESLSGSLACCNLWNNVNRVKCKLSNMLECVPSFGSKVKQTVDKKRLVAVKTIIRQTLAWQFALQRFMGDGSYLIVEGSVEWFCCLVCRWLL